MQSITKMECYVKFEMAYNFCSMLCSPISILGNASIKNGEDCNPLFLIYLNLIRTRIDPIICVQVKYQHLSITQYVGVVLLIIADYKPILLYIKLCKDNIISVNCGLYLSAGCYILQQCFLVS